MTDLLEPVWKVVHAEPAADGSVLVVELRDEHGGGRRSVQIAAGILAGIGRRGEPLYDGRPRPETLT